MSRKKQKKFNELKSFPNVLEWNRENFKEEVGRIFNEYNNVILELGCGKGEYSLHLGKKYPEYLIVGIDIQGERIWRGAKNAQEENLDNVFFLRIQIESICSVIPKGSVNEIWLTFPDPFPRERDSKRRLTSPRFLKIYRKLLKKEGIIHLKTDSDDLYEYTKETVREMAFRIEESVDDIYHENLNLDSDLLLVQTTFEKKHLEEGKSIKYLKIVL
jgi:tRNA (guanine-N7-)-methyltransferase